MSNHKEKMILSTLEDIKHSLELIVSRCESIKSADDFLKDDIGLERLDSVSMRLIAVGEGFKNIDKLSENNLLKNYPNIPWKQVKGIRDVLLHHYFDLDAETIFDICQNSLEELLNTTMQIINDISSNNY